MKSDVDDKRTPSVILMGFFETLPFKDRTTVSLVLTQIRNNLNDVIPNTNPISWFVGKIKQLQLVFMKIPLVLRKHMKTLLLEGLESSLEVSNPLLCIFTLCLCLSELSAFRNCDRSDLESEDIWTTLQVLNSSVFPKLRGRIKEQKTNLPSLLSWSYCMLAFTYHSCVEWIQQQSCKPSSSFCVHTSVGFDSTVLDHPTVPILMRHILQAQIKNEPYIIPQAPHTLLDLLFSSSISSNAGILKSCKVRKTHDPAACFIEYDEPPVQLIKDDKKSNCILKRKLSLPTSFQHTLQTDSFEEIFSDLSLLKQLLGKAASQQNWLLENLIFTLRQTPFILKRLRCCVTNNSESNDKNIRLYEQIYCLLLQLWFRAAVDRVLLKNFPQSYVWLCGFTRPLYEVMSIKGFSEVILWTGRFLAAYENLFRSSILNSPHWYLQMITDAVVAIIDKSEKGNQESISVDELDEILCTCMAAIVRPLHALRIEDHEMHPEISRVIKVPLESVVSHISCRSVKKDESATQKKNKKAKSTETASTPAISPRLRDLIVHHLILPMIRVCDKWALGQAKIGIKPHCAKALLNQLVSEAEAHYANSEGPNIAQKLDIVKPPAIGGLHVTEKLSLKRKR
uniref:Fanconi anemia group A protein n=1 Tax=Trichobilharzia regenti TaxID=157069 RepID=A0AA85JIE0_TRIRE|nr:unnamed protein product [Trichobilharzia regenti]